MKPKTVDTLLELEEANWFSKVGVRDQHGVIVLSSWSEAIEYCLSPEWRNSVIEASNQYCERLVERSIERFQEWNEIVREMKKVTIPLVKLKIINVAKKYQLPKEFEEIVQWDVLGLCMEMEYADVYPPGFSASQAFFYVSGHFPCGWTGGKFPKHGMRVIY